MGVCRLVRHTHTYSTLLMFGLNWCGMCRKMLNSFSLWIERSTCILAQEISRLFFASSCVNCPLTRKDGMFSRTPSGKMSRMVKHLSAITMSPGCRCWRSPQSAVIALSEAFPPYRSLVKVIYPLGATPIKAFSVVRPLYWLYRCLLCQVSLCWRQQPLCSQALFCNLGRVWSRLALMFDFLLWRGCCSQAYRHTEFDKAH